MTVTITEQRSMKCYQTFAVEEDGQMVGALQCVGPCWGFGQREQCCKGHRGPWIAYTGSDMDTARNLQGLHDWDDAVAAIGSAVHPEKKSSEGD